MGMAVPKVVLSMVEGVMPRLGLGSRHAMENGLPDAFPELLSGL